MAESERLQTVTLPFLTGIDQRSQLEALDPTTGLADAVNVRQASKGALSKRFGFDKVDYAETVVAGDHLFAWRGQPSMVAQPATSGVYRVRTRVPNDGSDRWALAQYTKVSEVMATRYPVASVRDNGAAGVGSVNAVIDACAMGPLQLVCILTTDGVLEAVVSDGEVAMQRMQVTTGVASSVPGVRVVSRPTSVSPLRYYAYVYYARASDNAIVRRTLSWDAAGLGVTGETVIAASTSPAPAQWWDAAMTTLGGQIVAWRSSSTAYNAVESLDGQADETWTESLTAVDGVAVGGYVTGANRYRYVLVHIGTQYTLRRRSNTGALSGTLLLATSEGMSSAAVLATGTSDAIALVNTTGRLYSARVVAGALATSTSSIALRALSRPFQRGGTTYAMVCAANPSDPVAVLAQLYATDDVPDPSTAILRPVASVAPRLANLGSYRIAGIAYDGVTARAALMVGVSSVSTSVQYATFDWRRRWSSVTAAGCQYLAGGAVEKYDGLATTEAGFLYKPFVTTSSALAAGVVNGTVRYVAIWEHVDNQGNVAWSAPSAPLTLTVSSKTVIVNVAPLQLTQRHYTGTLPRCVLYRTTNAGQLFYRVESKTGTGGAEFSFTDNLADSALISRPLLYKAPGTPGDFVDRAAPPGLYPLAVHQDRVCGVADDGLTVWCSNRSVQGESVYWSEAFAFPITDDGRITALASQDGMLFVFKRRAIYMASGDGKTENGLGGYTFQRLPADVGCIEPQSVVVTPDGVWFRSERGIELLARGGQVSWVGERIAPLLTDDATITSAVSDQTNSTILWTCRASDGNGFTLVYDTDNQCWYRDLVAYDDQAEAAAVGACLVDTAGLSWRYARLHADGVVTVEAPHHRDASTVNAGWITMSLETGWIRMAGLVGEQDMRAAYLLGHYDGPHGLRLRQTTDYRGMPATNWRQYTSAEVTAMLAGNKQSYRAELITGNDRRGMALRVALQDEPPTGWTGSADGESVSLVGFVFEGQGRGTSTRGATGAR